MKKMKQLLCLLMLALLSFALLAGCGSTGNVGRKWSDSDVIDDYGTVTRNGTQIDVCVCHDQKAIYLYYDDEEHKLFDTAMLPTDEFYDDDNDWTLGKICFSDFSGDGNDDLEVYISHSDMTESHIVWMWEEDAGYVYHQDSSWFYNPAVVNDPPSDDTSSAYDFSIYEGVWLGAEENSYDDIYIEFNGEGYWTLNIAGEIVDEGNLVYEPTENYVYADGIRDSVIEGGEVQMEDGLIYISGLGYFEHRVSEDDTDDSEINDSGANSGLHQRDVSEFKGVWYFDNDLSAATYIIIDENGNWSYFERVPGDPEGTEMDHGTLSCSTDEAGTYYAESLMYDDLQFRMVEVDEDIITWNEDTYYRLED